MSLSLAFIDAFCPRPYDDCSPLAAAMGGTELSVALLAGELAKSMEVSIYQHCRMETHQGADGVTYRPAPDLRALARARAHDAVVILNAPKLLDLWRRGDPACRLVLWRHNFIGARTRDAGLIAARTGAMIICVSKTHRADTRRRLYPSKAPIEAIHNPVRVAPVQGAVEIDPDRLIFASSPHKGLEQALEIFARVRAAIPPLRLEIANPGYIGGSATGAGVHWLGALDRPRLHRRIAGSLCLFNAQKRFAETFGLVFAESHALGTPVIAQRGLGAADEVIDDPAQLAPDVADADALINRLKRWRAGERPRPRLNPAFAPARVAQAWRRALMTDHSARIAS